MSNPTRPSSICFFYELPIDPDDFLGVDLGVANLVTDSDGQQHSGADVERVHLKCQTLRQKLQSAADQAQNRRRKRIRKKLHRRAQRSQFPPKHQSRPLQASR